ncbi:hypothetical protein GGI03_002609 [Coemansia sp. RSA 2337]|nr:hypothetical protein GGI03_002609 [Coemansia sp. RSA 2337]
MTETAAEKRKKILEDAKKARIAARKAEAEKKAKEEAEKKKARDEQARLRWPITRLLRSQYFIKGAVIVNVTTIDQALLCQEVGVTAISAYDKSVQASIVLRMSSPESIKRYIGAVLIPVIANVRIGHLSEAKIMESIGVNLIDESDMLTSTEVPYIRKRELGIPTICAVTSLQECLLRIQEGALILRVKGTREGGNITEALKYLLAIKTAIAGMRADPPSDTTLYADPSIFKPLLNEVVRTGHLPVPLFGSGGIHTPSDVAIMMENGCDGVFVDTAVFLGLDPETHLKAIMQATKDYKNTSKMCELSNYFI